jgi:hypothetical protein
MEIEYDTSCSIELKKNVKFKELDGYKVWNIQEKHRGKFVLNVPEPLENIGNPEFIDIAAYYNVKSELRELKLREHFMNCPTCEAVMCCPGTIQDQCGCMGQPTEFRPTDKCTLDNCFLLRMQKEDELKSTMLQLLEEGLSANDSVDWHMKVNKLLNEQK